MAEIGDFVWSDGKITSITGTDAQYPYDFSGLGFGYFFKDVMDTSNLNPIRIWLSRKDNRLVNLKDLRNIAICIKQNSNNAILNFAATKQFIKELTFWAIAKYNLT